ncbi:MAG: hypothetical protein IPK16_26700 [Anaerolineales bacterium]|nr:hypothetical protein [Anaerolineales bacterium]
MAKAAELPHWHGHQAQHAVLVVGIEHQALYLHDPALPDGPTAVSIDDFLLAWQEMDNRYAVLEKREGSIDN